ncbi:hypothetical protein [Streptomyces sp. NPDC051572]|uniref:hypothetical protein n=1 Tax=Streptomyces sp. NPDC051572 TaxID=3155802 RepID=UPI00344DB554
MDRGSSPTGTGGAGTIYECRVAALELAALLCRVPVAGLAGAPSEIRLQQGDTGYPLDDVVAVDRSGPFEFVVEKQVKRTLKVLPSGGPWRKTIGQCLQSLRQYGPDIDARRRFLGVVATGPAEDLEELAKLAKAADRPRLEDFTAELAVPQRRGKALHSTWNCLVTTVEQLMTAPGGTPPAARSVQETAFRIARRLVVEVQPEHAGATYTALLGLLQATVVDARRGPGATDVFAHLAEIAKEYGPQGGVIDVGMLRGLLHARKVVLLGDPALLPELEALQRWTGRILEAGRVGRQLGGRLHLSREQLTQEIRSTMAEQERVVLTGPAGVGKSALARAAAAGVRDAGAMVFAVPLSEGRWLTVADLERDVGARLEPTLAAAPGGERLLLVDGAEQVLSDGGNLLSALLEALPHTVGAPWRVLAVVRDQAADEVERVLAGDGRHPVVRVRAGGLTEEEVRSVLAEFPALRVLLRSARSARLLRNLYVVEQLIKSTGAEHGPGQVLGEEDVAASVYEHVVRAGGPGRGTPDERSDVYLTMADAVISGRTYAGLRGVAGAARAGLVSDGVLVRDRAEFAFAHDVQQDYAIAVRLDMSDAPDVVRAPAPRRLVRGIRLWAQTRLARAAGSAGELSAAWDEITAVAHRLVDVDGPRWADLPYEVVFELGQSEIARTALTPMLLAYGGLPLVLAARRRAQDPETALSVLDFLFTHAERLTSLAAGEALEWTAAWMQTMRSSPELGREDLVARAPAVVARWYDGGPLHAQDTAIALACAADRLDDTSRSLLSDIAARHPLDVQVIAEDQTLKTLMARHEPHLLVRLARAYYIGPAQGPQGVDSHDGVRELRALVWTGVERQLTGRGPEPADLGPFAVLLDHAPQDGLSLVGQIADAATTAVTRRDPDHGGELVSVAWPLRDGPRTYAGSVRVWSWPWAGTVGPGSAIAALAALRRWASGRMAAGVDAAEVVEQVLGCGESLALVAVVVYVLAEHALRVGTELDPALEQPEIWLLPSGTASLEVAIPLIVMRASRERQDAYRSLGQRMLAAYLARPQPPASAGFEAPSAGREFTMRRIAALLDYTHYRLADHPEGRLLVNTAVVRLTAEASQTGEGFEEFVERFTLRDDAARARDAAEAVDVERLVGRLTALEAFYARLPLAEERREMEASRAAIAAVIIKAAGRPGTPVDAERMQWADWAGEQVVAAAARSPQALVHDALDVVFESQDERDSDRSAALVLPILLTDMDLRRRCGLTLAQVREAIGQLAGSCFIEVRDFLASSLADHATHAVCRGVTDLLHSVALEALSEMVATAGLHVADEYGVRRAFRLPSPVLAELTSGEPVVDLRLAAPAVGALARLTGADCVHRAPARALLDALTTHDRLTWTAQPRAMVPRVRAWRLAHDEITAEQALAGDQQRLEETLGAFAFAPNTIADVLITLSQQATTPDQVARLLTLWPRLVSRFLPPGQRTTAALRRALLPLPADGVHWPAAPTRAVVAAWAAAHTGQPGLADHLIHALDRNDLVTSADLVLLVDVLGPAPGGTRLDSHRAVAFLRRTMATPSTGGPAAHIARQIIDLLADNGDHVALRAQRELEDDPTSR